MTIMIRTGRKTDVSFLRRMLYEQPIGGKAIAPASRRACQYRSSANYSPIGDVTETWLLLQNWRSSPWALHGSAIGVTPIIRLGM